MDYKINNLRDKIYKGFIMGHYGPPKIPSENEITEVIERITDLSYTPVTKKDRIPAFDYNQISGKFSDIIDDIDILFDSIEDESRDILDQLTASLKEHNGVKRELRRIRTRTNDIVSRKLGEEYLEYNFTESFEDVNNINTVRSDPIDTDAGVFTILNSGGRLLTFPHYRDRKLEFSVIESYSKIVDYGYVGETNATSILSKEDPRSISYRIQTASPTRLRTVLALQLLPDGKKVSINSAGISIDSSVTKGFIRLYYQKDFQWKDVPALSVQEIKGNNVLFSFPLVEATHIKFEFIKDYPDVPDTNEYFITINEVAVARATNRHSARLYSKPVILDQYSTETPVVNNISCVMDADVPDGCTAKVFVAQDILLSGQFLDSNGSPVYADSIEAVSFDPTVTGTVYLSDIFSREGISGLDPYRGFDFTWKEIKPTEAFGNTVPEVIEFNNTTKHVPIDNSLFNVTNWYLFGDDDYTGPWPQYSGLVGTIFLSGWCNSDNPMWVPFLSGAVESGWFVSGVDVANLLAIPYNYIEDQYGNIHPDILSHPSYSGQWLGYHKGYPFNYFIESENEYWKFGYYESANNGWYRPNSFNITPTGIMLDYGSGGYLNHSLYGETVPDYYFNGIKYYKIYKFGKTQNVIDSSIKLYAYQTRPVNSDSDYYPHNFVWTYKSNWTIDSKISLDLKDFDHLDAPNFSNYRLTLPALNSNEDYVIDGISEVRLHNSNFIFSDGKDYTIVPDSNGRPSQIDLSPLDVNHSYLNPSGTSFDVTYNFRVKNRYVSTWVSYAILAPNTLGEVVFTNPLLWERGTFTNKRIIDKILVQDLDTGSSLEARDEDGKIKFQLDGVDSSTNKHYKVTVFCASDESTGFSGKSGSSLASHFIPNEDNNTINVSRGIRFVAKLESLKIVDLSTLLYDTPMANDKRCTLITDFNGEKYLIAKAPSKDIFPSYYFDSISGYYLIDSRVMIPNKNHYVRKISSNIEDGYYTTGSSGQIIVDLWMGIDRTWNNGATLAEYPNTTSTGIYPNHSTYGYPINIDDSPYVKWSDTIRSGDLDLRAENKDYAEVGSSGWKVWLVCGYSLSALQSYNNVPAQYGGPALTIRDAIIPNRGFLFYNSAENLPAFYSISYRTVKSMDSSYSRFVYKVELESDSSRSVIPKVRSVRFRLNRNE